MNKTVEAVTFKLAAGTQPSAFMATNGTINDWLRRQPGFLARQLASLDDGNWLDVIQWKSAAEAKQANEKFMAELGECECMRMIDPESVKMSHGELRLSV